MSRPLRILLSAGEASGDRLGAGLARALRDLRPDIELLGMGGDEMGRAGVRLIQHASEVAVVGLFEVLRHLPVLRKAMANLSSVLEGDRPDVFVPIDFPDFNLRLASRARRTAVPVVYFVSPQIWAWRRGRVHGIRETVRRMLVLFPFEVEFYEDAGVPVTFVGHPAAEIVEQPVPREVRLRGLGLDPSRRTVALLPGSRRGEVLRHWPIMLDAARELSALRPGLQFVVARASTVDAVLLRRENDRVGLRDVHIVDGEYPGILGACDAGAVVSGTASLDAALQGLPMVVVYRMQPLSYLLARTLVKVDHIAMPNLIAGRRVVPELVQGACTPVRIAEALARYLDEPEEADAARAALSAVRSRLVAEGGGAFARAARAVLEEAEGRGREPPLR